MSVATGWLAVRALLALPDACFAIARLFARWRVVGWALYSVASGIGTFVAFCFAGLAFSGSAGLVEYGGVFQRVSLVVGLEWLIVVAGWCWMRAYREQD